MPMRRRRRIAHSLARGHDAEVWAWGWNGLGQLGDGTTNSEAAAVYE